METSTIMSSLKTYFEYKRSCTLCGIREVNFEGNPEDWDKLLEKLNVLRLFHFKK